MESIFNIFGSGTDTIKLQKSLSSSSSGAVFDAGPLKQSMRTESFNSKKVLGDIRNTLQQANKKIEPKSKQKEDGVAAGCSRTPLLPKFSGIPQAVQKLQAKSGIKNQTPASLKLLEVPKTFYKHPCFKDKENNSQKSGKLSSKISSKVSPLFQENIFNSPEIQGQSPIIEDNYADTWPCEEHPTLMDYGRIMKFWNDPQHEALENLQTPQLIKDSDFNSAIDSVNVSTILCESGGSSVQAADELLEPEMQGPDLFEDNEEDIWPASERPTLEDYKRIMVFWAINMQPSELQLLPTLEFVKDNMFDLDINLTPVDEVIGADITVPEPMIELDR